MASPSKRNLRFLAGKVASRLGWRKVLLLEKKLKPSPRLAAKGTGGSDSLRTAGRPTLQRAKEKESRGIELLPPSELEAYRVFRPESEIDVLKDRFERGDFCFVARHSGRIVSASWISPVIACISYLQATLPIRPGDAYMYDSYTAPEFRRRGFSSNIRKELLRYCRDAGYKCLKVCVAPYTVENLSILEKLAFTASGTIRSVGAGSYRCIWFQKGGAIVEVSTSGRLSQFL